MTDDDTRGHARGLRLRADGGAIVDRCGGLVVGLSDAWERDKSLLVLAESAPHDCGEETCPGFRLWRALSDVASRYDSMREEDGYDVPEWLATIRAALAAKAKMP